MPPAPAPVSGLMCASRLQLCWPKAQLSACCVAPAVTLICLPAVCCPVSFLPACRHGDLKAGNVLLQASTGISRAAVSMDQQQKLLRVWTEAGCLPLVAKVADFGLSLPLGHQDTHATLHARG